MPQLEDDLLEPPAWVRTTCDWIIPVRTNRTLAVLKNLRADSATGPDLLPGRILKQCSRSLCIPLTKLARQILKVGVWPRTWCNHWICPLHKRGSVWNPANYRGIHLKVSKCMERLLGLHFIPRLSDSGAYGEFQFADRKQRGARDALLFLSLSWISAFCKREKVLLYCSDVSGAFDHVSAKRLIAKLKSAGIPNCLMNGFASWLAPRVARVIVEGQESANINMSNMTYQGTVWGCVFWNVFFRDAQLATEQEGFTAATYADDLNAFKAVPSSLPIEEALKTLDSAQVSLHAWGKQNQVRFDPLKESKHVLSRVEPHGSSFKILGILFDSKLLMEECVRETVTACNWKIRMIVRTMKFHTDAELVGLYKADIYCRIWNIGHQPFSTQRIRYLFLWTWCRHAFYASLGYRQRTISNTST